MTARGWVIAAGVALCLVLVPWAFAPVLAQLNLVFMKVDLMAFGGGFTTIPLIQREVVDRFGWVTTKEFIDGIALGQVTPGPIVITATFVAYKVGGLAGALLGTIAVFFPSFVIVTTLAPRYERIKRLGDVQVMDMGEYLQEESRLVVGKAEIDRFVREVDELRDAVERIEARIARLI